MTSLYLSLIDLGLGFLQTFLGQLTANKAPAEVVAAVQAAVDALFSHKNDVITKVALESQRG